MRGEENVRKILQPTFEYLGGVQREKTLTEKIDAEAARAKAAEGANATSIKDLTKCPSIRPCTVTTMAELDNVVTVWGKYEMYYIDWSSPIAPDGNITFVICGRGNAFAITIYGKMFISDQNTNNGAWQKLN